MKTVNIFASTLVVTGLLASLYAFSQGGTPGLSAAQGALNTDDAPPKAHASGVKSESHPSGPIVHNWSFKVGNGKPKIIGGVKYDPVQETGDANLTINSDGSWNFSGNFPKKPDRDLDIVMGIKSSQGSVILFHYSGGISNGAQWDKTGVNQTLKDDFKAFTNDRWYASYSTPLSAAGIAKQYAEREARKKKLKAEELAKEQKEEQQQAAAAAAQQQQNSGGGGSSVWSTVGDVAGAIGGALLSIL